MQRLSGEVLALQQHQEHCDEIRELTRMLQESHRYAEGAGVWGQALEC